MFGRHIVYIYEINQHLCRGTHISRQYSSVIKQPVVCSQYNIVLRTHVSYISSSIFIVKIFFRLIFLKNECKQKKSRYRRLAINGCSG